MVLRIKIDEIKTILHLSIKKKDLEAHASIGSMKHCKKK